MMDWLADNPIANMYGPHFLVLYGIVIVVTLATCWKLLLIRIDSLSSLGGPLAREVHDEVIRVTRRIRVTGALVVTGLGAYKLVVALTEGRSNVLFLVLMGIGSLWFLFAMCPVPVQEVRD